ncbi:hypothetical protein ASC75_23655 [Aminobacter sp. DSM 101952]|uniref:GGDEF domain-containing protein n=1 Tax=Aminobacter sp. DSM 101952 TaxID=2735891 RepID=UPI0007001FFB|nr:GGDEF domain-containing protein [Aminobacter sp. DSM 101952]KQU72388.1 hypothetical protein ASC75_23655 [Aminobacter sp. DSM 101952]
MIRTDIALTNFAKLGVIRQSCLLVLVATAGADMLTLIFYGVFFSDRLLLDLFLTTVIVILVGFPLAYLVMGQQAKLATMAARLDKAARFDDLTGLSNRRTFFHEVNLVLKDNSGSAAGCLLFIDADHFKSINDAHGHAAGDVVLQQLGAIMKATIGEPHLTARLGGEEFAVFLVGAEHSAARQTADLLRMRVHQIADSAGIKDRQITVSIGVSVHRPGLGLEDLLLEADKNLYAAKKEGRDRVRGADTIFPALIDGTLKNALRH